MDSQGSALWLTFAFSCMAICGVSLSVSAVLYLIVYLRTPKPEPEGTEWRETWKNIEEDLSR